MIRPNRSARVGERCSSARRVPPRCVAVFSTPKEYPMECRAALQRRFYVVIRSPRTGRSGACSARRQHLLRLIGSPNGHHSICNRRFRRIATKTAIATIPANGTKNPIGKLFAFVETNPTSHGIAEPPRDAIDKTTPPNRRAAGPYQCENQEM